MLVNSSSSTFPRSPFICPVNTSIYPTVFDCFNERRFFINSITLTLGYLLMVFPLYAVILWMGFHQWKYGSSTTRPTSHADVFTYYLAATETINVVGSFCYCIAISICQPGLMEAGYYSLFLVYTAQSLFHFLTCVERYLAVVHPITYMGLKASQGVRIRNLSICCVYLVCSVMMGFAAMVFPIFPTNACFFMLAFIIIAVCFLSFAVFSVLKRPGVGSDHSKRRAFQTIMIITAVLLLKFVGQGVFIMNIENCEDFFVGTWLCLPCSLVMPLLFLHRKGKLTCFALNLNQSEN